jgi:hypothetical protein
MKYIIDMSGGLLRDLVKFMQDACKLAIVDKSDVINKEIAEIITAFLTFLNMPGKCDPS